MSSGADKSSVLIRETRVPKKLSYHSFLWVLLLGFGVKEGWDLGLLRKRDARNNRTHTFPGA